MFSMPTATRCAAPCTPKLTRSFPLPTVWSGSAIATLTRPYSIVSAALSLSSSPRTDQSAKETTTMSDQITVPMHPIALGEGDFLPKHPDDPDQEACWWVTSQARKEVRDEVWVIAVDYVTESGTAGTHEFEDGSVLVEVVPSFAAPPAPKPRVAESEAQTDAGFSAAAACVYCEAPIRQALPGWVHVGESCGHNPHPIPEPADETAGVSA
jgi:hypothetical protein